MPMDVNIKKMADRLVRCYQSRNPFEIIRGMNVILVFTPLSDIRGFYQFFQRNNIIYIDENLPAHEQAFVCAHELGHMLLHKKSNAIFLDTRTHLKTRTYEREADFFAMCLLIGDDLIDEYREYSVEQLTHLLGYQEELIEMRIK